MESAAKLHVLPTTVGAAAGSREARREVRWALGSDIDPFFRFTEPTTGDRVVYVKSVRDGSMVPLTQDQARRIGQALLDFADSDHFRCLDGAIPEGGQP
jgi:hypothetical protein